MRVSAPITNYIQATTLTNTGDMLTRDATKPIRIANAALGYVMQSRGAGNTPMWKGLFNLFTTQGDLLVRGAADVQRIASGALGTYLQGKSSGALPAYEKTMPPLTTKGDLIVQGLTIPERIVAPPWGNVLVSNGVGNIPYWTGLFNLLTTQGDIWVRGAADPQRLAAGALDAYLKSQGAGVLPIYEKLTLKDTGVNVGNGWRSSDGAQAITGVGFQPSTIIFLAECGNGSDAQWSIGFSDGYNNNCMFYNQGLKMGIDPSYCGRVDTTGGDYYWAYITTFGADGFTITWSKVGAPPNVNFVYLCLP